MNSKWNESWEFVIVFFKKNSSPKKQTKANRYFKVHNKKLFLLLISVNYTKNLKVCFQFTGLLCEIFKYIYFLKKDQEEKEIEWKERI